MTTLRLSAAANLLGLSPVTLRKRAAAGADPAQAAGCWGQGGDPLRRRHSAAWLLRKVEKWPGRQDSNLRHRR